MTSQKIDSAVPTVSVSVTATAPKERTMITPEMWRKVADMLDDRMVPNAASVALQELIAGTSVVEPVDKVAIDLAMLEAGEKAFKAHTDDVGATVVEIYKAMRAARSGA